MSIQLYKKKTGYLGVEKESIYQGNTSKGAFGSLTDTNHFTVHSHFICQTIPTRL